MKPHNKNIIIHALYKYSKNTVCANTCLTLTHKMELALNHSTMQEASVPSVSKHYFGLNYKYIQSLEALLLSKLSSFTLSYSLFDILEIGAKPIRIVGIVIVSVTVRIHITEIVRIVVIS